MTSIEAKLERFERAARAHEMKGAAHPDDFEFIQHEYEVAKVALLGALAKAGPEREPARAHLCNALAVIQLKEAEWCEKVVHEGLNSRDVLGTIAALKSRIERAIMEIDAGNAGAL